MEGKQILFVTWLWHGASPSSDVTKDKLAKMQATEDRWFAESLRTCFSRKRPRRVPSKKGLSLKIVIKHRPKFY